MAVAKDVATDFFLNLFGIHISNFWFGHGKQISSRDCPNALSQKHNKPP